MKILIIYNYVENRTNGRALDTMADNEVEITAQAVKKVLSKKNHIVELMRIHSLGDLQKIKGFDFIFNLAEGIDGDLRTEPLIAEGIEKLHIPFSGNNSGCLEISDNKHIMKSLFVDNNIRTPKYKVIKSIKDLDLINMAYPLILKLVSEHGSVGICSDSVVFNQESLRKKTSQLLEIYKQPIIAEEFIDGREIHIPLIGNNEELTNFPLIEIKYNYPAGMPRIYSFETKWLSDSIQYKNCWYEFPTDLNKKTLMETIRLAKKAYNIIGCRDYARVDIILKDNLPYVLEVNPNACINPDAECFRSASFAGLTYEEFINSLLSVFLRRYKDMESDNEYLMSQTIQ